MDTIQEKCDVNLDNGWEEIEVEDLLDKDFGNDGKCSGCGQARGGCDCETCPDCEKPLRVCECDQFEQADRVKAFFEKQNERLERDKDGEEDGEFTSSMVLERTADIFQVVAEEAARTAGVPETMAIAGIMAAVSAGIGKGLNVEFRSGQKTSLGLYVMGFDPSGSGKTESTRATLAPLYRKQRQQRLEWESELPDIDAHIAINEARLSGLLGKAKNGKLDAKGAAEVLTLKKDIADLQLAKKSPPSIWTEDTTMEAVRDLLVLNNSQLSMISDDAGKPLQNLLGAYNKLQMPEDHLYLKMYSVSDYCADRVGKGSMFIPEAWGSLFWLTQPDKLALVTGSVWLKAGGFLARCLIAQFGCRPHVMSDDSISPSLLDEYTAAWNRIYDAYRLNYLSNSESKTITASAAARELMKEWEANVVDRMNGDLVDFRPFAARYVENTKRIAGVLHVMRNFEKSHETPLARRDVETAITIMRFFIGQQLALMSYSREDGRKNELNKMVALLQRNSGEIAVGKLRKNGHDAGTVVAFCRSNPTWFEVIETEPGKKGGKPTVKVRLIKGNGALPATPKPASTATTSEPEKDEEFSL